MVYNLLSVFAIEAEHLRLALPNGFSQWLLYILIGGARGTTSLQELHDAPDGDH
jgi:hypothetical protein